MPLWKLTPTDPSDPIWKHWSPDPVLVRAESEVQARQLAQLKTSQLLSVRPGEPKLINPWGDPSPTTCQDVTGHTNEFPAQGPAAVLGRAKQL